MDLKFLTFKSPTPIEPKSEVAPTVILCQNCHVNERATTQSFLCDECITENNEIRDDKKVASKNGALPVPDLTPEVTQTAIVFNPEELPIETNGKHDVRALRFAPPSVRYDGKRLDEIAWSMLPALPDSIKLDIRELVLKDMRAFVSKDIEPTVQDIDVNAEWAFQLYNYLKALGDKKKSKIVLSAKPELKRQEKERKEQAKVEKIQKAIPKDVVSTHTANILLKGIAEIIAPPDKSVQATIKAFLDHVQLQSQVEDEITGAWLSTQLMLKRYQPIKQYFRINQNASA